MAVIAVVTMVAVAVSIMVGTATASGRSSDKGAGSWGQSRAGGNSREVSSKHFFFVVDLLKIRPRGRRFN